MNYTIELDTPWINSSFEVTLFQKLSAYANRSEIQSIDILSLSISSNLCEYFTQALISFADVDRGMICRFLYKNFDLSIGNFSRYADLQKQA